MERARVASAIRALLLCVSSPGPSRLVHGLELSSHLISPIFTLHFRVVPRNVRRKRTTSWDSCITDAATGSEESPSHSSPRRFRLVEAKHRGYSPPSRRDGYRFRDRARLSTFIKVSFRLFGSYVPLHSSAFRRKCVASRRNPLACRVIGSLFRFNVSVLGRPPSPFRRPPSEFRRPPSPLRCI